MINLEYEKTMMLEQTFIGQVLLKPTIIRETRLAVDDFADPRHKRIMGTMFKVAELGLEVNLMTIVANAESVEALGGVSYLAQLVSSVPTAANWDFTEQEVRKLYVTRQMQEIGRQMAECTDLEEMNELADQKKKLDAMLDADDDDFDMKTALMGIFEDVERDRPAGVNGIPSGFRDLDRLLDGFQLQDLVIVGARPSVGKTAFALNIGQQGAKKKDTAVSIFSLEMPETLLLRRMISAEGNIESEKIRRGKDFFEGDDWEKLTMAIGTINDLDLKIYDKPGPTVAEIRRKVQRRIEKQPNKRHLIIIDYLTLIRSSVKSDNRNAQVEQISRDLKLMARELNVCVICLSQLSRGVEQRQDKRPMMSDLRESGAIEQDADVIAFLYRDDYYDAETEKKNIIEINIAKHRNGPTGVVELVFLKQYNKFVSLNHSHAEYSA